MLKPLPPRPLADLIPQAVLSMSLATLRDRYGDFFHVDEDEFDEFSGVFFLAEPAHVVAIGRYRGHPPETATIYIDAELTDVAAIRQVVGRTVRDLAISDDVVSWQRGDSFEVPVAANQ